MNDKKIKEYLALQEFYLGVKGLVEELEAWLKMEKQYHV